jgi:hypothetical protein
MPVAVNFADRDADGLRSDETSSSTPSYVNGDNPSTDIRAHIGTGENATERGRVDLDRRMGFTRNETVYSTRFFRLEAEANTPMAGALEDPDVCGSNPCDVTQFIVLQGGFQDGSFMRLLDDPDVLLMDGLLDLAEGQSATTRMGINLHFEPKTVLRYGYDCSSANGNVSADVEANRVTVTRLPDEGGARIWEVEGVRAHICLFGRFGKGKPRDPRDLAAEYGLSNGFHVPFRLWIRQIGPLAPRA